MTDDDSPRPDRSLFVADCDALLRFVAICNRPGCQSSHAR